MSIAFQVNQGSSEYWFEVLIIYEEGDGDLGAVYLQQVHDGEVFSVLPWEKIIIILFIFKFKIFIFIYFLNYIFIYFFK